MSLKGELLTDVLLFDDEHAWTTLIARVLEIVSHP